MKLQYGKTDIEIAGKRYASYDLSTLKDSFVSQSQNCKITEWELYDSDGSTKLQNQDDIKVTYDASNTNLPKSVHIDPSKQNHVKEIYLRNKDANPSGQCNWQCYIERYPQDNIANWDDAKDHWDATGKAAGRNCRCDEIASIKIIFKIVACGSETLSLTQQG